MSDNLLQHILLALFLGIPSPLTALIFFRYLEGKHNANSRTDDSTIIEYERIITELCLKVSTLEKERI